MSKPSLKSLNNHETWHLMASSPRSLLHKELESTPSFYIAASKHYIIGAQNSWCPEEAGKQTLA
jgi:hypothetical protein